MHDWCSRHTTPSSVSQRHTLRNHRSTHVLLQPSVRFSHESRVLQSITGMVRVFTEFDTIDDLRLGCHFAVVALLLNRILTHRIYRCLLPWLRTNNLVPVTSRILLTFQIYMPTFLSLPGGPLHISEQRMAHEHQILCWGKSHSILPDES
jgi:hypothetical protein